MYLYVLDIKPKNKLVITTKSENLLYNLIPFDPEALKVILEIFPDYHLVEIDEKYLPQHGERQNYSMPDE